MPDLEDYLDPLPSPRRVRPTSPHLKELTDFARENNLRVGSTTGGTHNKNSLHYSGNAIDIKGSGGFDDAKVGQLTRLASQHGLKLRDERVRPRGQKVWGGPHVHVEYAGQEPGSVENYLDPTPTKPVKSSVEDYLDPVETVAPKSQPSAEQALLNIMGEVNKKTARMEQQAARRPARPVAAASDDPFALLKSINAQPVPASPDDALREQAMTNTKSLTFNPVTLARTVAGAARRGMGAQVDTEAEEEFQRLKAAQGRANTPEMIQARKGYGALQPLPGQVNPRAVIQPLAKTAAGLLKLAAGAWDIGGILPENEISKYLRTKGQFMEEAASLPPLDAAGEEIKRKLPEKVVSAVADTGLSIAEIVLLKKASGLPLGRLLALETALKSSDEPADKRAARVAESYAMGRVLDTHLSRPASALLFGGPIAAREGQSYLNDQTSLEDAILQTAVQTGVGGVMGGKPKGEGNARQAETQRQGVQAEQPTEVVAGTVTDRDTPRDAEGGERVSQIRSPVFGEPRTADQPQRFYHKDWGEVVELPDQSGARRGRVKVAEVDNPNAIHYPKRADLSGRGNQRLVPIKTPNAESTPSGSSASLLQRGQLSPETILPQPARDSATASPEVPLNEGVQSPSTPAERVAYLERKLVDMGADGATLENTPPERLAAINDVRADLDKLRTESPLAVEVTPVQPSASEGRADRIAGDAKLLANIAATSPFREQGLRGLDVPSQREVLTHVLRLSRNPEVRDVIVQFVPVDMVDNFMSLKPSSKVLLHDKSVNPEILTINGSDTVSLRLDVADSIVRGIAGLATERPPTLTDVGRVSRELNPTVEASTIDQRHVATPLDESNVSGVPDSKSGTPPIISQPSPQGEVVKPKSEVSEARKELSTPPAESAPRSAVALPELNAASSREPTPYFGHLKNDVETANEPVEPRSAKPTAETSTREGSGPTSSEPTSTAARREKVTADRAARGEAPTPKPERKPDEQLLADAKAANEKDPNEPLRIVDQVLNGKKGAMSDTETVQIDLHVQELKNKYDAVNKELANAKDAEMIKDLTEKSDAMEREMRASEEAFAQSGTEKGRSLRAQRFEIDNDFRPLTMIAKRIKAKGDKPLTTEERELIKTQAQQIVEWEAKLKNANTRIEEMEAERAASRIKRDVAKETRKQTRGARKQSLDDEAANLKDLIAQAWKKQKGGDSTIQPLMGLGKFDPEGEITKLVFQLARNRVKANVGLKAEALVDAVHELVKDVSDLDRRRVAEMISGYGRAPRGDQRSEVMKQLASVKAELKKTLAQEDIAAGRKLSPRDKARQAQLLKQETEYERRLRENDFTPNAKRIPLLYNRETLAIQQRLETIKREYSKANYRATRGRFGMGTDELAKAANVPKTLKSMGDVSAMFRQGGFYAITHPVEGLAKPTRDMLRSFTEAGYRNVENAIKNDADFENSRRDGVEYTGVDKTDPNLSHREESYFGGEAIDLLASGKYNPLRVVKGVKNFSERTFISFLDSQRLHMYKTMKDGLTDPGIIRRTLGQKAVTRATSPQDFKNIAKSINIGTGRGDIPRFLGGDKAAPVLNVGIFAPRLIASRVQLLNNMFNPVKMARMSPGSRNQMIADNVKFLAATAVVFKLAEAAGGSVNRDPDDADFLKIRFGNTTYDTLTGLQQPHRYIINMTRAATGGETYSGKDAGEMTKRLARSKVAPGIPAIGVDYLAGEDFEGRPFSLKRELIGSREKLYTDSQFSPLPAQDFVQATQEEGLVKGFVKATPAVTGIGVQSYPERPDKPTTKAEKLARKFVGENIPHKIRTEEQIETSRKMSDLKVRSRKGEDVKQELADLEGQIRTKQAKSILGAVNKTRFQEDFNRLSPKQAAIVYGVATETERAEVKDILERKSLAIADMADAEQADMDRRLKALGMIPDTGPRRQRPQKAQEAQKAQRAQRSGYSFQN